MRRKIEKIKDAVYGRGYVYNIHYHLIWVTKYRRECFTTPELREEMKNILFYISKVAECVIEQAEVMPDHVHLFVSVPPTIAPCEVVKAFKGQSGRQFLINHPEFTDERYDNSLWAPSYFVASAGEVSSETIKAYIEGQYD